MLRKKKKNKDPIAERLKTVPDSVTKKRTSNFHPRGFKSGTLQDRNAEWADQHELADYETIHYIDDTDPEVMKFIKYLGYDPVTLEKAIITVEVGKTVKVESTGYVCQEKTNGSPIRYSNME